MNDDDESLRSIGAFAAGLPRMDEIDILPYNRLGLDKYSRLHRSFRLPEASAVSGERMTEIAGILEALGLRVKQGG